VLFLVLRKGGADTDALFIVFLIFLVPLLGTVLLFVWTADAAGTVLCIVTGFTIGLALPLVGGLCLFLVTEGFERPAILVGAFILGIPSSIGGALAGWIFSQARTAERTARREEGVTRPG